MTSSYESTELPAGQMGLPSVSGPAKLDPDLVVFVEALARYGARIDHEAELWEAKRLH